MPREPWVWAALTGVGASAVIGVLGQVALMGLRVANVREVVLASAAFTIVAVALGLAVAWRAGGARAIALYFAIHVAYALAALPGLATFCERSSETNCFARFAPDQWPTAVGAVLALVVVRFLNPGGAGRNPSLSATGAYSPSHQLLALPMAAFVFGASATGRPEDLMPQLAYYSGVAVVAAAVSGVVLGVRHGTLLGALVPMGVIALTWGLQLPGLLTYEPKPPWTLLTLLTGPAQLVALLLAWAVSRRNSEPLARPNGMCRAR